MCKVAIIGAGNFGSALHYILSSQEGIEVVLWDIDESKVTKQASLQETVRDAQFVFLCVSSWSLRKASESILPFISAETIIISPTKGIEQKTLKTSDEVLLEVFGVHAHTGLLHGPMLANEIMQNLPAFATASLRDQSSYGKLEQLFAGSKLQLEYSKDVHGVALAGVLKNIYSIGLGMADAMLLGSNFRGWFVRVAVLEMSHIITNLGADSETAYVGAGLADLIATGFSPHSRNCKVGHELVQSGECITVSEGAESLPYMIELLRKANTSAPLCEGIYRIMEGKAPASAIDHVVRERRG